MTISEKDLQYI